LLREIKEDEAFACDSFAEFQANNYVPITWHDKLLSGCTILEWYISCRGICCYLTHLCRTGRCDDSGPARRGNMRLLSDEEEIAKEH
jgi:hypothetical protein